MFGWGDIPHPEVTGVKHVFVDTSVLVRCSYAHIQLLELQVYSAAGLCPDQTFLSLCHRRHVAALCMLCKVNSNSNHCFFSELP